MARRARRRAIDSTRLRSEDRETYPAAPWQGSGRQGRCRAARDAVCQAPQVSRPLRRSQIHPATDRRHDCDQRCGRHRCKGTFRLERPSDPLDPQRRFRAGRPVEVTQPDHGGTDRILEVPGELVMSARASTSPPATRRAVARRTRRANAAYSSFSMISRRCGCVLSRGRDGVLAHWRPPVAVGAGGIGDPHSRTTMRSAPVRAVRASCRMPGGAGDSPLCASVRCGRLRGNNGFCTSRKRAAARVATLCGFRAVRR
jgi:hypothetical protein